MALMETIRWGSFIGSRINAEVLDDKAQTHFFILLLPLPDCNHFYGSVVVHKNVDFSDWQLSKRSISVSAGISSFVHLACCFTVLEECPVGINRSFRENNCFQPNPFFSSKEVLVQRI
jgi:hypothetical protein